MAGTKGRSGGKRVGAGRKPGVKNQKGKAKKEVTLKLSGKLLEAAEAAAAMAKKHGYTVDQFLLGIVYADKKILAGADTIPLELRERVAQRWQEYINPKVTEQNITVSHGPAIGLPARREDPALKVVKGGKKKG
jgi:hypothetical protein